MNKKLLIATMLTLPLVGCFGNSVHAEDGYDIGWRYVEKIDAFIEQYNGGINCRIGYYHTDNIITPVLCGEFYILSTEQKKEIALRGKRSELKRQREKYLELKLKFESIDCKSTDEDGDGFYTVCPSVNEFGEPIAY